MKQNELKIYYPFKPFHITQKWGKKNPMYKEHGFKFERHNGIDAKPRPGADKYLVWCPVEGFIVNSVKHNPNGGGHMIWLMSKKPLQMFDQKVHAYIGLMHAEKILVPAGYEPKLGELIMIGDNTGFSTGPHTHIGLYRVKFSGPLFRSVDRNDADNSFAPELFFTEEYAVDKATTQTLVKSGLRYLNYLITK